MSNYTVRIGARRAKTPAHDIYAIPYREAGDDGAVLLAAGVSGYDPSGYAGNHPDVAPLCIDCRRGHVVWAEAGYVSWHRICDVCGSHWDLHPITWGPTRVTPDILQQIRHRWWEQNGPREWCETCDYDGIKRCQTHRALIKQQPNPEYARWIDGKGYLPLDPAEPLGESGKLWGDLLALVTDEHWRAAAEPDRVTQMANSVTVCGCWARRARFY